MTAAAVTWIVCGFNSCYGLNSWEYPMKTLLGAYRQTPLMISQHLFRQCVDAVAIVYPDLCRHIAGLGHNKYNPLRCKSRACFFLCYMHQTIRSRMHSMLQIYYVMFGTKRKIFLRRKCQHNDFKVHYIVHHLIITLVIKIRGWNQISISMPN